MCFYVRLAWRMVASVNLGPICELVFYSQSSGNCCHDVAMTAFGELTVYSSVLTQGDKYCF